GENERDASTRLESPRSTRPGSLRAPRMDCAPRLGRSAGPSPYRASTRRSQTALLAPPLVDPRVIAREEDVGHAPAAEIGGARVVRVLEAAAQLGREALDEPRLLRAEGARQPARTYGPIEIESEARCPSTRSSQPSKRAESRVSRSSPASSSTTAWVSS